MHLNKIGVAKSFSKAANSYNRWAKPQQIIANELNKFLQVESVPKKIADLGVGTGFVTDLMANKYPAAEIMGFDLAEAMVEFCNDKWKNNSNINFMVFDLEADKFKQKYDLMLSSCVLQWFKEPRKPFANICNALDNNGTFAAAIPVIGTLQELTNSYQQVFANKMSTSLFYHSAAEYLQVLADSSLQVERYVVKDIVTNYDNGLQALQSFKGVGATFQFQEHYRPLMAGELKRLISFYEQNYRTKDGKIPVTYSVLFFQGRR